MPSCSISAVGARGRRRHDAARARPLDRAARAARAGPSISIGLVRKSVAPRFIASTAVSTVPKPVDHDRRAGRAAARARRRARRALHVGQLEVEDEGVELLAPRGGERRPAVRGLVHRVAVLLEHVGQARPALGVVLDEEDRRASARRARPRAATRVATVPSPSRLSMRERAAVRLRDPPGDGQPEAGAALARREEGVEHARQDARRPMPSPVSRTAISSRALVAPGLDHDRAALRRGLQRVQHQVQDRVLELERGRPSPPRARASVSHVSDTALARALRADEGDEAAEQGPHGHASRAPGAAGGRSAGTP